MDNLIKVTFLGDLMCKMQEIWAVNRCGCGYGCIFEKVKDLWRDSQFVVANLETPATGPGFRLAYEEMRFNAPVEFLSAIRNAGIDLVTTANNHILDRGRKGLDSTLKEIENVGLETTGAYLNEKESKRVFVKEVGGLRIAFLACTHDTNPSRRSDMLKETDLWKVDYIHRPTPYAGSLRFAIKRTAVNILPYSLKLFLKAVRDRGKAPVVHSQSDSYPVGDFTKPENSQCLERFCDKIKLARENADVVVVLPHIGGQYNSCPGPWQLKVTDRLIEAGADVVIANHAHTALACEERNGAFVAHALGNFCFTPGVGYYNDQCQADYSLVLHCWFDTKTKKLSRKAFSITKSIVRDDGVSVVVPVTDTDTSDVNAICRRVTGRNDVFPVKKEYEL